MVAFSSVNPPSPALKAENHSLVFALVPVYFATIKDFEEQIICTPFFKYNPLFLIYASLVLSLLNFTLIFSSKDFYIIIGVLFLLDTYFNSLSLFL